MAEERFPPADLDSRVLKVEEFTAGTEFHRLHTRGREPLHFRPRPGGRFNDPEGVFGVCYLALSPSGAFAETLLRRDHGGFVAWDAIEARMLCRCTLLEALRVVAFHGPHQSRMGANLLSSNGRYAVSQAWARALFEHPNGYDGILYRCVHDSDEFAVAVFDRAQVRFKLQCRPLAEDRAVLRAVQERYGLFF